MQRRARSSIVALAALTIAGCGEQASNRADPRPAAGSAATSSTAGSAATSSTAGSATGGSSSNTTPAQDPALDPSAVVIPNLDSAVINVEPVDGAKDYRAFVLSEGVQMTTDDSGHETLVGATVYCAGLRQRAAPALKVPEVVQQIEVTDLHAPTTYVVEAIDQLCPFPGAFGAKDDSFDIGSPDALPELKTSVPILSEASIRAKYGNMIFNGQGPGSPLGLPAANNAPKVLKRWTVQVNPLDAATAARRRTADFFADFSDNDQPKWVPGGTNDDGTFHEPSGYGYSLGIYQNQKFDFYATNAVNTKGNHVFIDRGQLNMILPDAAQDTMATVMAIPRKLAHVSDTGYLHVTYENSTNSTARRYWWLSLCGAEHAGETFDSSELLSQYISLNSGFFGADGMNPSVAKWNCLIVFPHDGIATAVPSNGTSNPQSSVIVLIHRANAEEKQSAVDVSPQQLNPGYPSAWYRTQHAGEVTATGVLDDLIQMAPRARFDLYISRSRLVMYVNGQQRLCNDFGPEKLTMAEAAVGFNDALYHSSAEHTELTASFADRSGQLYYLNNTIYEDLHSYDNVGFEENVAAPSTFDDSDCYVYQP
jgi:hypothetical protein